MSLENPDINELAAEALAEETTESRKYNPRGQTRYIKQALIRIFRMKPEVRATYVPQNGWEEVALKHFNRCLSDKGTGTAAFNALRESIGESISKQKSEEKPKNDPMQGFIDDLPRPNKSVN
jgi:hypothetical protein